MVNMSVRSYKVQQEVGGAHNADIQDRVSSVKTQHVCRHGCERDTSNADVHASVCRAAYCDDIQDAEEAVDAVSRVNLLHHAFLAILEDGNRQTMFSMT